MATKPRLYDTNLYYHIYNCGVARQSVFSDEHDYTRFIGTLRYYQSDRRVSYAQYMDLLCKRNDAIPEDPGNLRSPRVSVIAYCLMPNHFHIALRPLRINGVTLFLSDISNSYTRYYNIKYSRLGSLFQGTFKAKAVDSSAALLNLSRYIHLNPEHSPQTTSRGNQFNPDRYPYSSYREWLGTETQKIINNSEVYDLIRHWGGVDSYRSYIENRPSRNLIDGIESLIIEV